MSKLTSMARGGWIVVGIVIALLLVPSVAVAAGLTYNGIEGVNKNKAAVTPDGQVLAVQTDPYQSFVAYFGTGTLPETNVTTSTCSSFGDTTMAENQDAVITDIHVSVYAAGGAGAVVYVYNNNSCSGTPIVNMNAETLGETGITFSTPVLDVGPSGVFDGGGAGNYFSAVEYDGVSANVVVNGYITNL
jgi:hypothetical protein